MHRLVIVVVVLLSLVPLCACAGQSYLIFKPGSVVQSGSYGYRTGEFTFYSGFDIASVSGEYSSVFARTVDEGGTIYRNEWEDAIDGSAWRHRSTPKPRYCRSTVHVKPCSRLPRSSMMPAQAA